LKFTESDKEIIRLKFWRYCTKVVHGEALNYLNELRKIHEHEIGFSELTEEEWNRMKVMDDYLEKSYFPVFGLEIPVNSFAISEALKQLPEKKRNIILMSYFLDMTEKEIAKYLDMVQSTVHYHKTDSLKLLKEIMK